MGHFHAKFCTQADCHQILHFWSCCQTQVPLICFRHVKQKMFKNYKFRDSTCSVAGDFKNTRRAKQIPLEIVRPLDRWSYMYRVSLNESYNNRERKMRTKFFCTNFLNTARGPGHPGKNSRTSRILSSKPKEDKVSRGHEVFGHHPFAWKTPTPPGGLRTQKLNLCALFSCLQ